MDIITALISKGAQLHTAESSNNATAIMIAAERGYIDIIALFLETGVDIDHTALDGFTALLIAMEQNQVETAMMLINNSANITHATQTHI